MSGQPLLLGAPVLKTVFINPSGQDPPPDTGAILAVAVEAAAEAVLEYSGGRTRPLLELFDGVARPARLLFEPLTCAADFCPVAAPAEASPGVTPPPGVAAPLDPAVAGAEEEVESLQGDALLPAARNKAA